MFLLQFMTFLAVCIGTKKITQVQNLKGINNLILLSSVL